MLLKLIRPFILLCLGKCYVTIKKHKSQVHFWTQFCDPIYWEKVGKPLGGLAELMRLFTPARNGVHYTNILFGSTFSVAVLRTQHW